MKRLVKPPSTGVSQISGQGSGAEAPERGEFDVVAADFVTTDSGTGIVHVAPAFGEVDYGVLMAEQPRFVSGGPELLNCVAPDGTFTDTFPMGSGRFVKECDRDITRDLRGRVQRASGPLPPEIEQTQHLAQFRREPLQPRLQKLARLTTGQNSIGPRRRSRFLFQHRKLTFNRIRHPVRLRPPVMIYQQVPRQPRKPHRKRALARAETAKRFKQPQEHLLRQILSLVIGAGKAVTDSVDAACMDLHQILPGVLLACQTPLYQLLI